MLASADDEVDALHSRMKIVHVETGRNFYGGAQQVIWLIRGLVDKGVESVLVCPPGSAIDKVARESGLTVINIPCAGEHDFRFAWRLHSLLRREKPDLLHCHSRRGADFPGGWAALFARVPAVVTRRVDSFESPTAAAIRYAPFRKVAAISENVAAVLRKSRVSARKLSVIRSAVDVDAVNAQVERQVLHREFGISVYAFAIAVVAQLIKRKGHRFLLDVLPGLLADTPGIKVVFFGTGKAESQLRALTAKLGLSGAVQFAGFRDDLDEYLAAFDLLVHPAEKEGLGVAMLKAAAAGLPVVAFNTAGSTEAVVHAQTGILVEPGDMTGLQRAVGVLVGEPDIGKDLGAAGRKRMRDEFSVASMVESYVALYEEMLNE
jgi:glycosyltransferase involved in cell wall biosynthesis